jgi:hypothetical protein
MNETDEHQTSPESDMEMEDKFANQEDALHICRGYVQPEASYTDGIICDAIASRICLGTMIDSLNEDITNISDGHNSSQHVLGAYKTFFGILQKELEEQNIEKVQIGEALDVAGQVGYTLDMTPNDFFICSEGQKEKCTLQDVLETMYEPKHVIGCIVGAIMEQHNRLLIDELKSAVKYVSDLVNNERRRRVDSDSLGYTKETDNHIMGVGYNPTTREADIDASTAASSEGKKESESEDRDVKQSAQDI